MPGSVLCTRPQRRSQAGALLELAGGREPLEGKAWPIFPGGGGHPEWMRGGPWRETAPPGPGVAPASARTCSLPLRACSSQLPTSPPPCVWAGEGDGEEAGSVLCGCPRAASRHRAGSPGVDYLVHGPCAKKPSSSAGFSALITSRFAKMFEPGTLYQKKKNLPYRPTYSEGRVTCFPTAGSRSKCLQPLGLDQTKPGARHSI